MLEAVNSVLQTAPLVRAQAEQVSTTDSFAANPDRIQKAAPQAPYISPFIHVDVNYDKAVLLIRDADTGDVLHQYPTESALRNKQSQQIRQDASIQADAAETAAPAQAQQSQQVSAVPQQTAQLTSQQAQAAAPAPTPVPQKQASNATAPQFAAFAAAARSGGGGSSSSVTVFA